MIRAVLLMGAIRLGLRVSTVGALRLALGRLGLRPARAASPERTDEIAHAVMRASAVVPGATCLVQAVALEALLVRRGVPAQLQIGFGRTDEGAVRGHAWVEAAGTLLGAEGHAAAHARAAGPQVREA